MVEYDEHRAAKMKADAEMAELKMKKLKGEVIPVDYVQKIFGIHFKNVSVEFYNVIDNMAIMMTEELKGNREHLVRIRKKLKQSLNDAIKQSKEKSKVDLREASKEFSDKKHRGENG